MRNVFCCIGLCVEALQQHCEHLQQMEVAVCFVLGVVSHSTALVLFRGALLRRVGGCSRRTRVSKSMLSAFLEMRQF